VCSAGLGVSEDTDHDQGAEDHRAKVGPVELAKQLGNVSQACKMMGYSRDSFYRFKELYETAANSPSRSSPARSRCWRTARAGDRALIVSSPWSTRLRQIRIANEIGRAVT
jgi:hypothetical protein